MPKLCRFLAVVALLGALLPLAIAQTGAPVNQVAGPPPQALETLYAYSGGYLSYICYAYSLQPVSASISISAASNASPAEFTSASHSFDLYATPQVTVSGGTGNWVAVNGTWTATITGVNTFTVPVDSSLFGAVTGTLVFTTQAPRKAQAVWAVQMFRYDGSNNLVGTYWAGGNTSMSHTCAAAPSQYQ
jgi:hypothetical protein